MTKRYMPILIAAIAMSFLAGTAIAGSTDVEVCVSPSGNLSIADENGLCKKNDEAIALAAGGLSGPGGDVLGSILSTATFGFTSEGCNPGNFKAVVIETTGEPLPWIGGECASPNMSQGSVYVESNIRLDIAAAPILEGSWPEWDEYGGWNLVEGAPYKLNCILIEDVLSPQLGEFTLNCAGFAANVSTLEAVLPQLESHPLVIRSLR